MSASSLVLPARHVVLGAGPLGRATAAHLAAAGHRTTLVNRSGKLSDPPVGVELAAADIRQPDALAPVLANAAAVYFCAQPPYHQWPQLFPALQAAAIAGAAKAGARLVIAENLYGYGHVDRPMTEDMPLRPNTRKGKVRADMHHSAMAAHRAGEVQVAVARGSDFFGPYVEGSAVGGRFFRSVIAGQAAEVFGDPCLKHSYTFIGDFAAALARLGTDARSVGEVWHVPNAPAVSTRRLAEIAFWLAEQPLRLRRVGQIEMHLIGAFVPAVREMIEMDYEFNAPFTVDASKFESVFGDLSTPLEAALDQTISWTKAAAGASS